MKQEWTRESVHNYHDKKGDIIARKVKMRNSQGKKRYFWERLIEGKFLTGLDGISVPIYNMPEVTNNSGLLSIIITEGEKDADSMKAVGLLATTGPGGAGSWDGEHSQYFRSCHVAIIPDNDEAGVKHGQNVANSLRNIAATVRIVKLDGLKDKGDITDWIDNGGTANELVAMINNTPTQEDEENLEALITEGIELHEKRDEIVKALSMTGFRDIYMGLKKTRKMGDEVVACCPFHDDKDPSFSYNVKSGLWHCHAGCGGGSAFDYEMAQTNETYAEVMRRLSVELGIDDDHPRKTAKRPFPEEL